MEMVFTTKQIKEIFGLSLKTSIVDSTNAHRGTTKVGVNSWILKKREITVNRTDYKAAYEATAAMNENMKIENERLIHKNKELKLENKILKKNNEYYTNRCKKLNLVSIGVV